VVNLSSLVEATVMFVATNIDDFVVLMVFFGQARGDRAAALRVVAGQYLGFGAILVVSVIAALGAQLLPRSAIAYFGLVPIMLGLRAAWTTWSHRDDDEDDGDSRGRPGVGTATVAAVTFANGGDNIGVYVPVFAVAGPSGMPGYVVVFLIGVGLWCALSRRIAEAPPVAELLERWEHVVLPVVFIGIGLAVLIKGTNSG